MKLINNVILCLFIGLIVCCHFSDKQKNTLLPAHSHNDYEHYRPLFDALGYKFKSIEVDVFSIGDSLYVAHDNDKIKPGRTLRQLYLDPLKERIKRNNGTVYGNGDELILLVDIKDDGLTTYKLLHQVLVKYQGILTSYDNGVKNTGAIAVIVSGNRPLEYMQKQELRYAGYDGRISDLTSGLDSSIMPLVSDNWKAYFKWNGLGNIPADEKEKLMIYVQIAHSNGHLLRFWATPNHPVHARNAVWNELINAHVDLIGSDDLKGLHDMLKNNN